MKFENVDILGVQVAPLDLNALVARLEELIQAPGCAFAYGVNAHGLNLACRYPDFMKALLTADLVYADGASLLLAARVMGGRLPEKVATADAWPLLCSRAVARGYRFFFLGGEPGLAERARDRALKEYPGLQIVGAHHGYVDLSDRGPVDRINAAAPDVLWVGMGEPKQGLWIAAWRQHLKARLVLNCGGMFKIVAGELDRADHKWRQRGWEWLYRLWREPKTWRRYLLGLPEFALRVLAYRARKERRLSAN